MNVKKNGEIELLRFLVSMCIVIFHFSNRFKLNIFIRGNFGVEFFFIVTGALLGMSASKVCIDRKQVPEYTYVFIKRKILKFYPYYLTVVLILNLLIYRYFILKYDLKELIAAFCYNIPRLLLIDSAGFLLKLNSTIRVDWYLSAMILSTIILFPPLLYNYKYTSNILCPILGIFGLGILFSNYGRITKMYEIIINLFRSDMLRGLSEIALGVWIYELALKVQKIKFTKLAKICLTILKWLCFFTMFIYMYGVFPSTKSSKNTVPLFFICLIGIMLSFSQNTINIPYNSFTQYLGSLSLFIYLSHLTIAEICLTLYGVDMERWKVYLVICICPVIGHLVMIITDLIKNHLKKYKYLFIENQGKN